MGNAARILLIAALGLASIATSKVEDDPPPDANIAAVDGDLQTVDADSNATDAAPDSYRAVAVIGALDRIIIVKADAANDVCALLRLVNPAPSGSFGINTPAGWGIEFAGVSSGTTDCLTAPIPQAEELATDGSGSVTFTVPMGSVYPTMVSADAVINLDTSSAPSWVPASVSFQATDLPL